jgi:iron complex transport system ATP-binding protein
MKLQVVGIDFAFNSHPVLTDVTFCLKSGELVGILGVNGAGKSTLLKCLNRILTPRKGAVLLNGKDVRTMRPGHLARRVGYVPQRHPDTRLTVYEAVLLGRKPHIQWAMTDTDHQAAETAVRRMGIAHLALRPVNALSGGEIQKVVIARALAQSPELLLLDEPTSNLDLKNQLEVMALVRRMTRTQGVTAVVAIHDLNMAVRYADRFLMLRDHRIHAVAARAELTSEMIRQVYGVEVALAEVNGQIAVVPL